MATPRMNLVGSAFSLFVFFSVPSVAFCSRRFIKDVEQEKTEGTESEKQRDDGFFYSRSIPFARTIHLEPRERNGTRIVLSPRGNRIASGIRSSSSSFPLLPSVRLISWRRFAITDCRCANLGRSRC